jgi:peptidoglycan/LPS O-acetylase OafA/YrhL
MWQQGAAVTDVIAGSARRPRPRADGEGADETRPADPADPAPGEPVGRTGQIGIVHEPALDGLRGLAVAAVVIFHLDHLRGGFLGVDLFFVLSGFLITSLLVTEHGRRQTIDVGRFWVRRARRLLPALFLTLIGVSVLLVRLVPGPYRARFRDDALATLGYFANWQRMTSELGYWDIFSTPSPFDHMWSLAIEEQFYVVWPVVALLVLGLGRRRVGRLAVVAAVGAAVSFTLLWITWSPVDTNRAYFSTDTRLGPTLLGATLAVLTARRVRREGPPPVVLEVLALLALAWMTWSVVVVDGLGPWYYRGGLVTFALATVAVIHAVTGGPPGLLGRALSWTPLRLLGTISYGVYLWHWPVIVFVDEPRSGLDGPNLDVVRVVLTLGIATASYLVVERPIRRRTLTTVQLRGLVVVGVAVTSVVVLAAMWGTPAPSQAVTFERVPVNGSTNPYLLYPEPGAFPPDATRVLLVGDSGVQHLGPAMVARGAEEGVSVATSAQLLCTSVSPEGTSRSPDGRITRNDPCNDDRIALWTDLVDTYDPDIVIYYLANTGQLGEQRLDGEWVDDCDPPYDAYLRRAIRRDIELLGAGGARVFMTTSPQPAALYELSFERTRCRNETYRQAVDAVPGTQLLDLKTFVQDTIDRPDWHLDFYRDPVHFSDAGARAATEWLLPLVGAIDRSHAVDPVAAAEDGPP